MVSVAVRTAGPARSGFIRADQPETDSAPATWSPGPRAGLATQTRPGPGFLGVVGEGVPLGTGDERCQRSPRQFALPPCNDVAGMSDVIGSVAH